MSFLGPIPFGVWAAIAGGAALLAVSAYIIKMRRRRFEVPFSRLWQRVLEQRDANALWKQLKRLLSLLLILFIIAIMLFAALDPTLGVVDRKARSVIVLFDASASMKAMDGNDKGDKSRLDAAKDKAKRLIDGMGGGDVAMIMKVDGQATPMSRFSSDAPMLDKIIDGLVASDTPADLTRALGAAADALRDRTNPLIVLVSDGAFPEQQLSLVRWTRAESIDSGPRRTEDRNHLAARAPLAGDEAAGPTRTALLELPGVVRKWFARLAAKTRNEPRRSTSIAAALEFCRQVLPRRAVLFLISDFLDDGYLQVLRHANRKHDVVAALITDPREAEMPPAGLVTLEDAETGALRLVDTRSAAFRRELAMRARDRQQVLRDQLRATGMDLVVFDAAGSMVDPLLRFFRERERRLRR